MNEKITIRIATVLTALILAVSAISIPAYAAGDTTIPTLTAVVNNGMLTVDATDDASGIAAIYVNGFEFTELNNGSLTIRMQQYDTGYQYFTMQAKDGAGNMSEVYRVNNPYYSFPDEDNGEEVEESTLPKDASPTKPSNAEGEVTEHVKTDNHGNKTDRRSRSSSSTSSSSSSTKSSSSSTKKSAVEEDDDDDLEVDSASKITAEGREFYTIMTKTGKVFYLVIDRTKDEETVHFLTDITENDLLNATEDNKPTLPQNSAVVIKDAGLADMRAGAGRDGEEPPKDETVEETVSQDSLLIDDTPASPTGDDQVSDNTVPKKKNFIMDNLVFIVLGALIIVIGVIVKLLKRNDQDAAFMEDEEADDDDEYPDDSDEEDDEDDNNAFMDRDDYDRHDPDVSVIQQPDQQAGDETDKEKDETEIKEEREMEEITDEAQEEQEKERNADPEEPEKDRVPEQEEPCDKEQEERPSEDLQVSGRTFTDPDGMYTARSSIRNSFDRKSETDSSYKNTEETIYI